MYTAEGGGRGQRIFLKGSKFFITLHIMQNF